MSINFVKHNLKKVTHFLNKTSLLFLLFSLWALSANAQVFTGTVLDNETNEPIPYADVFFVELNTGRVTDMSGQFEIEHYHPKSIQILISFIGYTTLKEELDLNAISSRVFYLEPTHMELEEVIVSFSTGKLQNENVVSVEQKKITELQNSSPLTLAEAISNIAGVEQNTTGVGIGKPIIRGLSGSRIVTYSQGIRVENQQWGSEHGLGVGEVGIESVEVIKGPASLLYGSDALGGVLYFVDERYATHNTIEGFAQTTFLSNTLGSINNVGLKLHNEKVLFNLFGSLSSHADYNTPQENRVINTRFNEKNVKASLGFHKNNWISNIRYSYLLNNFGISEDATYSSSTARDMQLPFQTIGNHALSIENTLFTGDASWDLTLGYTSNKRQEFEDNENTAALDMNLRTGTYNLKWTSPMVSDKIEFIIGSQGMWQTNLNSGEEQLTPDATTKDIGVFGLTNINLNQLQLQFGIRYDQRAIDSQQGLDDAAQIKFPLLNKKYTSINYSGGAVYSLNAITLRANIASGFRAPNTSELLSNGVHEGTNRYEIGNSNLVSEQATQVDFSFDVRNKHIEVSVNPFMNVIKNYIFISPTGTSIGNTAVYEYKQTNATLMGGEFGVHYHPHSIHWLHLESNLAVVYAQDESDKPLPLIPATNINTTLKVEFTSSNKFRVKDIHVQDIYKFTQDRAGQFETSTASYNILNIGMNLVLRTKGQPIEMRLGIKNVLNTTYIDHLARFKPLGIPNPGINGYIGLKVKFNKQLKSH